MESLAEPPELRLLGCRKRQKKRKTNSINTLHQGGWQKFAPCVRHPTDSRFAVVRQAQRNSAVSLSLSLSNHLCSPYLVGPGDTLEDVILEKLVGLRRCGLCPPNGKEESRNGKQSDNLNSGFILEEENGMLSAVCRCYYFW